MVIAWPRYESQQGLESVWSWKMARPPSTPSHHFKPTAAAAAPRPTNRPPPSKASSTQSIFQSLATLSFLQSNNCNSVPTCVPLIGPAVPDAQLASPAPSNKAFGPCTTLSSGTLPSPPPSPPPASPPPPPIHAPVSALSLEFLIRCATVPTWDPGASALGQVGTTL